MINFAILLLFINLQVKLKMIFCHFHKTLEKNLGPHLHYGDIIYEKAYNLSVQQKIKYVQYNTCLAITGAIRGTSKEKLDDEPGLESLQLHRWFRKLFYFYKLYKHESPQYLFKVIPLIQSAYATRNTENISHFKTKHKFLKNSLFPSAPIEWNNLDHNI